ncbi:MAG: fimbria/pilus periplasmic chaperone [Pseudomonadota bacterium]|nr:fimbria/pilus periplasmic chaperone [Pseudomonadota bacterium]
MLKKITLVALALVTLCSATASYAEGAILFVSPHRVVIEPKERTDVVSIANQSDRERKYEMIAVDQVMNENGVTQRKDTFQYSAKRMLRFVPQRVTLKPGERQIVRIMARRPADLDDGDYHSHLLFREVPNKDETAELAGKQSDVQVKTGAAAKTLSFNIGTYFGVAIPIIVQKGEIESGIEMGQIEVAPRSDGKVLFASVPFIRSGNSEASGFLKVYIQDASGEAISSQVVWVRVYREVDQIVRKVNVKLPEVIPPGAKVKFDLYETDDDQAPLISSQIVDLN